MAWPAVEAKEEPAEGAENEEAKVEEEEDKPVEKKEGPEKACAAFVKIQNYRDPPAPEASIDPNDAEAKEAEAAAALAKTLKSETQTIEETAFEEAKDQEFDFNKVPTKIILSMPHNSDFDINLLLLHSEACFFIRKHIIEKAQKYWAKELKDIVVTDVLSHCNKKQRILENLFEEDLYKIGFN